MSNKPQILSRQSIKDLAEVRRRVLGTSRPQGPQPAGRVHESRWYWAQLTSALNAPTNGMASPTTATFDIWIPDGTDSTPEKMVRSSDTGQQGLTLVNRFKGLSAVNGTFVQVERDGKEWSIKGADC